MIELREVSVIYAGERAALWDLSLQIGRGEFVFVVGPTGAGKSTLLKLLYRAEVAARGTVLVDNRNVASLGARDVPKLRRKMGIVFQDYELLPNRTVLENVAFALRVIGAGRREIRAKVPAVLEQVGMMRRCDAYPGELSGGERQRVAIARALVNNPPLLLADEPTGNLDPDTSMGIASILIEAHRAGTTVVVATHDKLIVDDAGKRVVELCRGSLVRDECPGAYSAPLTSRIDLDETLQPRLSL